MSAGRSVEGYKSSRDFLISARLDKITCSMVDQCIPEMTQSH